MLEDNASVPSYFIANVHNELYAFYTGNWCLLKKILSQWDAVPPLPFESATAAYGRVQGGKDLLKLTTFHVLSWWKQTVGGENGGASVSAPSSFIANAHSELYAFYTGEGDLLKKNLRPIGDGRPTEPLWIGHCRPFHEILQRNIVPSSSKRCGSCPPPSTRWLTTIIIAHTCKLCSISCRRHLVRTVRCSRITP